MWWINPLLLFVISFFLGIVSVLAGIGGGSIYVPVVAAFFPFNFDLIRGAGLFLTLGSSLSAAPRLLKQGFADIRLSLPFALSGAVFSVIGAKAGLAADERLLKITLGVIMVAVSAFMILNRSRSSSKLPLKKDFIASMLHIGGVFKNNGVEKGTEWSIKNSLTGMVLFAFIGIISGMFGIGGGWAGVPVLNLVLGVPLKLAAGTSSIIISANSSSAIWVYISHNAVFPLIALPSFLGVALGSKLGARFMGKASPRLIRTLIIAFLVFSGIRLIAGNL